MIRTICAVIVLLVPSICLAQEAGGQAPAPQAPPPQTPTPGQQPGGRGQQPQTPVPSQDRNQQQNPFPEMQRQIYLSGSVRLSDGTVPPTSLVIERVCNGVVRPEAYTDSKGNFSFLLGGQNSIAIADASVGSDAMSRTGFGSPGNNNLNLTGCELRANLSGFQSDSVQLAFRNPLDNPDVGIIHIRRLANVDGYTFSITSGLAPKDARKAYEKGLDHVKKKKWAEAQRELTKAVEGYPKYAVAWFELGRVHQQEKKYDDANRAYTKAIEIDPKFVSPYAQLAVVAVVNQKWDEVAQYTSQVLKLNPYIAPEIYFYSAVANYNLNKFDLAEDHARHAARLDTQHKTPRINHLLGVILADKQDYKEAAEHMRIYLKFSADAPDAPKIKELLAAIEKADLEQKPK